MARRPVDDLSLNGWAVLTLLVTDGPSHGFGLAALLGKGAELGQVWTVARPQIYRSLELLTDLGLAEPTVHEAGAGGPPRTIYRATARGRPAARRWLDRPVGHLRDVRAELLLKVLLSERDGRDPTPMLRAQRARFAPLVETHDARRRTAAGADRVVAVWRSELARASIRTIDALLAGAASSPEPAARQLQAGRLNRSSAGR